MDSFPTPYGARSCDKEKLSIPLEAHYKAQSSEIFYVFCQNLKRCNFLSFVQPCWCCIFKLPRSRAFQQCMACPIPAKKSGSSHLFGPVPSPAAQTVFVLELSKAVTFFCLTFYPCEIADLNLTNRELSNDVLLVVVRQRKVALHTSSHLTPTEGWRSADSTTSEGRRVLSEVR